jgi:hypothetical protein
MFYGDNQDLTAGNCRVSMMCRHRVIFALLISLLSVGCQKSDRLSVTGRVTLDGQPLASGVVNLVPLPGTKSPTSGSEIIDGEFSIAAEQGLLPGEFRVEITAMRSTGETDPHPVTREAVERLEQYLPACYNTESTQTVNVAAGEKNHFEFPLESN